MGYKKRLFLLFIYIYALISDSTCDNLKTYNKYKKIDLNTNDESECVCFDNYPNKKTLPQLLDPFKQGLDRIVVLLYRDIDNNVQMLIPSLKKQALIPDLQVDIDDISESVDTDSVIPFFNYRRNILNIHPFISTPQVVAEQLVENETSTVIQPEPQSSTKTILEITTEPIGVTDTIEPQVPENYDAPLPEPENQNDLSPIPADANIESPSGLSPQLSNIGTGVPPPADENNLPPVIASPDSQTQSGVTLKPIYDDDETIYSDDSYLNQNLPEYVAPEDAKHTLGPIYYPDYVENINSEEKPTDSNESAYTLPPILNIPLTTTNNLQKDQSNIEPQLIVSEIDPAGNNKNALDQILPPVACQKCFPYPDEQISDKTYSDETIIRPAESSSEKGYYNNVTDSNAQNDSSDNKYGLLDGMIFNPSGKINKSSNTLISNVTFTQWFANQIKNIKSGTALLRIDIQTLQILIQQALKEQGLFVSKSGILMDLNGHHLNMSHLVLRPILIGEIMPYQSLLSEFNKSLTLTESSSYLKALLITVLYPPKIIGVIPVGRLFLPKTRDLSKASKQNIGRIKPQATYEQNHNLHFSKSSKEKQIKTSFSQSNYSKQYLQNLVRVFQSKQKEGKTNFNANIGSKVKGIINDLVNGRRKIYVSSDNFDSEKAIEKLLNNLQRSNEFRNKLYKLFEIQKNSTVNPTEALRRQFEEMDEEKLQRVLTELFKTFDELRKVPAAVPERRFNPTQINTHDFLKDFYKALLKSNDKAEEKQIQFIVNKKKSQQAREENITSNKTILKTLRSVLSYLHDLPKELIEKIKELLNKLRRVEDDRDKHQFRIIGGAAATGSGSPLSSRGRSGLLSG